MIISHYDNKGNKEMIRTYAGIIEHIEEEVIIPDSQDAPSKRNPILIQKLTVSGSQGNIVLLNTDFVFCVGQRISVEYDSDNLTIIKDNTLQPSHDNQETPVPVLTVILISLFPYVLLFTAYLSFKITNVETGHFPSFINDFIQNINISIGDVVISYPLYALFNFVMSRIGYYVRNLQRSISA